MYKCCVLVEYLPERTGTCVSPTREYLNIEGRRLTIGSTIDKVYIDGPCESMGSTNA